MRNAYLHLLKVSWHYAVGQRWKFLLIYGSFCGGLVITSTLPWLYGWFVKAIQADTRQALRFAWIYVLLYFGLNLAKWGFYGYPRIMEQTLGFHIGKRFTMETYDMVLRKEMYWHQERHSGDLINRVKKAGDALKNFYQSGFLYFHAMGRFVLSAVAMLYFTPLFGAAGIILGLVAVYVTLRFDKPLIKHLNEVNEREHIVASGFTDSLSNIITIKTLRLERQMSLSLLTRMMNVLAPFRRGAIVGEWKWFATDILVALIYSLLLLGYMLRHQQDPGGGIAGLVTLVAYVTQFTGVFYEFAWQYNQLVKYYVDVSGADEIRTEEGERQLITGADVMKDDAQPWNLMEVKGINFGYTSDIQDRPAFTIKDVSLVFRRGRRIAIIGESGSGKSTVLNLLRGLYDFRHKPQIILDGDLSAAKTPSFLYKEVILLPQEPEIFENTIRYNLTLGLDYDEAQILKACEVACFSEVLTGIPGGIDACINEKGVNLSGGQKQRLALARGVLLAGSAPLVLMDEPTSSVDVKNERLIYQRIFNHFENSAVVSTVHRLYLLQLFDYIYVMRDGCIADEGDYPTLLQRNDWLQKLLLMNKEETLAGAAIPSR